MNPLLQGTEQAALPGRLNPFYLEGRPLPLAEPVARALNLRDGQVIQATIAMRGDTMTLLLSGQQLDLPPGLRFRPGEEVWLRAYRGIGGWVLKPTAPATAQPASAAPSAAEAASGAPSRLLALALRPPSVATLLELFNPSSAAALLRAAADPELVAQFGRLQLSMQGLSPGALQRAVLSSGIWLEAMLGRGQAAPAADAKSLLRRLARSLGEREAGVVGQVRQAIDDVESAQVDALAAQARGELSFSMVLPFTDANPVHIRFFRPPRRPGSKEAPPFSVDVHTVNDELGEIWLKTSVSRAAHVELMMWALKDSVVRLAQRHSPALGQRLAEAGLTLDSFRIFHAPRPDPPDNRAAPGAMLDVSA